MLTTPSLRSLPIASIRVHPLHPRRNLGPIEALAADIRDNGLIEPLVVVPGTWGKQHGRCGSCGRPIRRHSSGVVAEHVVDGGLCPGSAEPASDDWVLLAGARRLEAAKRAGLTVVECVARFDLSEREQVGLMVRENVHRFELPVTELAEGLGALRELGWTATRIGQWMKIPKKVVDRRLALLDLPARQWRRLDRDASLLPEMETHLGLVPPPVR